MQTDYAGQTVPVIDPATGVIFPAQIFVAVLGASNLTFAFASFSQKLPDWIDGQVRALAFFGGVTKAIVCDNLKAGVAKALWFEPTLNATFAAMAEHYDTTILPTRSRKPRDKGKVEGAVLIVERWILARLRNRTFFSLAELNSAIAELLEELNNRPMRHVGKSRRELFEEIERAALGPLPATPFEYAEWRSAKVHPDYQVEVDKTFYSVPLRLIGRTVQVPSGGRDLPRSPARRQPCPSFATLRSCHRQRPHADGASALRKHDAGHLDRSAAKIGPNAAILVERLMRDRPHRNRDTAPPWASCRFRRALGRSARRRPASGRSRSTRSPTPPAPPFSSPASTGRTPQSRQSRRRRTATSAAAAITSEGKEERLLTNPTLDQMQALGLAGMAAAWRQLAEQRPRAQPRRVARPDARPRDRHACRQARPEPACLSQAALSRGLYRRHRFCRAARAGPPQHNSARAGRMAEDA